MTENVEQTPEHKLEVAKGLFDYWMTRAASRSNPRHANACVKSAKFWAAAINEYEKELGQSLTKFLFPRYL